MKMPQLNINYASGATKRKQKEESIKADEKYKRLLNRYAVVRGTGEPKEQSASSSTQFVKNSYVCLVHNQMCHTQKCTCCNNEIYNYMLEI